MKRLAAAILSLATVMTLCACGASSSNTTPPDGKTDSGSSRKVEKPVADTLDDILAAIADDYEMTIQTLQDGVDAAGQRGGNQYRDQRRL